MGKCLSKNPGPGKKSTKYLINPNLFVKVKREDIKKYYTIQNKLSEGTFSEVYLAIHNATQALRAVKVLPVLDKTSASSLLKEVEILKELDHQNIIKIYEVFQSNLNLSIVTEYCRGGELYSKIQKSKGFSENKAANYIHQIASAVFYLHSKGIVHRDLKPENILFESDSKDSKLKIIDFGTCKHFEKRSRLAEKIGSPYYIAPEVILGSYNEKCDVWSLGVILYIMLSGSPPFPGKDNSEIITSILMKEVNFDGKYWKNVSPEALQLLKSMLSKTVSERISAEGVLNHPWVQKFIKAGIPNKKLASKSFKNLSKFAVASKLHRATLSFIVNQIMSTEELAKLKDLFSSLDLNGDGLLSKEELRLGAKLLSLDFSQSLEQIIENVDLDGNGQINYSEFLLAATNWRKELSRERLVATFQEFDKDGSGGISAEELIEALGGGEYQEHIFYDMVKQADKNGDGQIDLEEFICFMKKIKL